MRKIILGNFVIVGLALAGSSQAADGQLANGLTAPDRPWTLTFSQDFKYDTNVVRQKDDVVTAISDKDSLLSRTSLFGLYEYIATPMFVFAPELAVDFTYHFDNALAVKSNNSWNLIPALRNRVEHKFAGKPASLLWSYEMTYANQNSGGDNMEHLYTSHTFELGEKVHAFSIGPTIVGGTFRITKFPTSAGNDYLAPGAEVSQNFGLAPGHLLYTALSWEMQNATNATNDVYVYRGKFMYFTAPMFFETSVNLNFIVTATDTRAQSSTRGTEILYMPSLNLYREIWGDLTGTVGYAFTHNSSKDKVNQQYTKSVISLGVSYSL